MSEKKHHTKAELAAIYESVTALLTATGRPMTIPEILEHPMCRPINPSVRSMAQWLKYLTKKQVVIRRGVGVKRATYQLRTERPPTVVKAKRAEIEHVIITLRKDGMFQSVQAPAGLPVSLELVA